jgi:hypothetical protein
MSDELKLISTDDLIHEIMDRFDHAVFSGIQIGVRSKDDYLTIRKWFGNSATAAGLCSQLQHAINCDSDSKAERLTPDNTP